MKPPPHHIDRGRLARIDRTPCPASIQRTSDFAADSRRFGLTVVCASVAAGFVKDTIKTVVPEPLLVSVLAAVIALYISAMFWFTSDPSISVTRTKPR